MRCPSYCLVLIWQPVMATRSRYRPPLRTLSSSPGFVEQNGLVGAVRYRHVPRHQPESRFDGPRARQAFGSGLGHPPGEASQPNHRSMADSISLVASIRAGLRSTNGLSLGRPRSRLLLPQRRIVAFYGNPLSKRMGVLGEYPSSGDGWQSSTVSSLSGGRRIRRHPFSRRCISIASVAQGQREKNNMYRQRSDTGLIEKVYGWAKSKNASYFSTSRRARAPSTRRCRVSFRFSHDPTCTSVWIPSSTCITTVKVELPDPKLARCTRAK